MQWKSLYICCDDSQQVVHDLEHYVQTAGFELYDPFNVVPGKSFARIFRFFVGPVQSGWLRILGEVDTETAINLSDSGFTFLVELDSNRSHFTIIQAGQVETDCKALFPHLVDGCTLDQLRLKLSAEYTAQTKSAKSTQLGDVSINWLPDDVQQMADNLNPNQINKLFDKFMNKITRRLGENVSDVQGLLAGNQIDWNSPGARQAVEVMACLRIPNWNIPDFVTLRDAYQLRRRLQRKPNAHLFPGEAEALEAVPDALDYVPVYGGQAD